MRINYHKSQVFVCHLIIYVIYQHLNKYSNLDSLFVPTHVVTLTQVGTSVYLGQTHMGTPVQVPAWVRKFSFGSTGDEISSLIIIQSLFVQQKFEY